MQCSVGLVFLAYRALAPLLDSQSLVTLDHDAEPIRLLTQKILESEHRLKQLHTDNG